MPTQTERTERIRQIELIMDASPANFTHAFESLLGRMPADALSGLHSLSAQAARESWPRSWDPSTSRCFRSSTTVPS